jgi:pilus assembly protein CpaC
MKILTILTLFLLNILGANEDKSNTIIVTQKENEQNIFIENNTYKFIEFNKRIIDITLSHRDTISIDYVNGEENTLSKIKVFGKKIGSVNAFVTFFDKTTFKLDLSVVADLRRLKSLASKLDSNIEIEQVGNSIILKGNVKNNKIKAKLLSLFPALVPTTTIVDLLTIDEPDKMVRLKLYVAEINNKKGETLKNNWAFSGTSDSGKNSFTGSTDMLNAVTLSGGLAVTANRIGSQFNTGLTLNYLKTNGVAKILDETTLLALENKPSKFLAGGTLKVRTSTTSSDGQPISSVTDIPYGLDLKINVNEIINNKFIKVEIDTASSSLDTNNIIDGIPGKKEKSIQTNVIVEDGSTIVLGGLVNNTYGKDLEKIPFLGDIPILGALFRSKSFQNGDSELIFFITPEIVNASSNNQTNQLENQKATMIVVEEKKIEDKNLKIEDLEKKIEEDTIQHELVKEPVEPVK